MACVHKFEPLGENDDKNKKQIFIIFERAWFEPFTYGLFSLVYEHVFDDVPFSICC